MISKIICLLAIICFNTSVFAESIPKFPFDKRPFQDILVFDYGDLMDDYAEKRLDDFLRSFQQDTDIEFIVVTRKSGEGQDINQWTNQLFQNWQVGKNTKGNKGLMLVVFLEDRQVRMEVGTDLEGVYTDAFVGYIEREQMKPFFEQGNVAVGIEATLELIVARTYESMQKGEYSPEAKEKLMLDHLSGGGGARRDIDIASRQEPDKSSVPRNIKDIYKAQPMPGATFKLYLKASLERIKDPELGIYTDETKEFFRKWTVTNAQQDSEIQFVDIPYALAVEGDYAVIYFPDKDWTYNPFFFKRSSEGWQMDFATMHNVIMFTEHNYWHFVSTEHPYMFAFKPYKVDDTGFVWFKRKEGERGYLNISFPWGKVPMEIRIVHPQSSAAKAGVRVGDVITQINHKDVRQIGFSAAVNEAVGPIGTSVHIQVYRPSQKRYIDFNIMRTEELN